MGTTCYIKADHGETRDETNPLTAQDEIEFAPKPEETEDATEAGNSTGVTEAPSRKKRETTEKTLTAEEIRIAGKAARTELRLAELAVTHTGEPDCVPPKESKLLFSKVFPSAYLDYNFAFLVFWDACVIRKKTIDGTDIGTPIPDLEMDQCSYECTIEPTCKFWEYKDAICNLKSDKGAETDNLNSFYGSRSCTGRVEEPPEGNEQPLDGNWSPWSTLATPCFNKRDGALGTLYNKFKHKNKLIHHSLCTLVECGGGIQYRYRSCSNPHPRAGGKTCKGEDFDEHPCNLNNCPCKYYFL